MGSKGSRCHDEEATEELIRMSWRLACNTYSVSRRSTDSKSSFKSSVNLTSSPINAHSRDVACDKASPKVLRFSTKDDIVEESDLRAFHEEFVAQVGLRGSRLYLFYFTTGSVESEGLCHVLSCTIVK